MSINSTIQIHPGEEILLIRRRHWLPFVSQVAGLVLATFIPVLFFAAKSILPYSAQVAINAFQTFPLFIWMAWALFLWTYFGIQWTNYYLDILVVTNKRVIDIDQIGLFARDVAEVRIERVEDIRVEVIGIIASFLHFGNLHIQTAGQSREFIIKNIPHPQTVADTISRVAETMETSEDKDIVP